MVDLTRRLLEDSKTVDPIFLDQYMDADHSVDPHARNSYARDILDEIVWLLFRDNIFDDEVISQPKKILEIGSAFGREARCVADSASYEGSIPFAMVDKLNLSLTASDYDENLLKIAKEKSKGYLNIDYVLLDGQSLPFKDESYDVVFSSTTLHHFPSPLIAVKEMLRVAKPSGGVYIHDLVRDDTEEDLEKCKDVEGGLLYSSKQAALSPREYNNLAFLIGDTIRKWSRYRGRISWTIHKSAPHGFEHSTFNQVDDYFLCSENIDNPDFGDRLKDKYVPVITSNERLGENPTYTEMLKVALNLTEALLVNKYNF